MIKKNFATVLLVMVVCFFSYNHVFAGERPIEPRPPEVQAVHIADTELKSLLKDFLVGVSETVLSTITDIPTLISYWKNTPSDSEAEKIIEVRMAEVLKEQLPTISDIPTLNSYWKNTPSNSEARKLIEARMAEMLKEISGIPILISYWKNTSPNSEAEKIIEARMAEVLKEQLPTITDIPTLISYISYWGKTPLNLESEKLIKARITEVLESVSRDNIPKWFISWLKHKDAIPLFLKMDFEKKAEELYEAL